MMHVDRMLIAPLQKIVIWADPMYEFKIIVADKLDKDLRYKAKLGEAPDGYDITQAFSYFTNENIVKPKGWIELNDVELDSFGDLWGEAMEKLKAKELYYASH